MKFFVDFSIYEFAMKNGNILRYTGFKPDDRHKIIEFFKNTYNKDCVKRKLSLNGWNWGRLHFTGSVLRFDCGKETTFEIPLQHLSQCTTDNEVTMEFHSNEAPVSLVEMRMYIPSESSDVEPVDEMKRSCFKQSVVKSMSDDVIAIFKEIQCLTPRGHYEMKVFRAFIHLHGKTFDHKIPLSTVLQMFLLPHKDKYLLRQYHDESKDLISNLYHHSLTTSTDFDVNYKGDNIPEHKDIVPKVLYSTSESDDNSMGCDSDKEWVQ